MFENAKCLQALDNMKLRAAASLTDSKYLKLLNKLNEKDTLMENLKNFPEKYED